MPGDAPPAAGSLARREFIAGALATAGAGCLPAQAAPARKPNILLLILEDSSPQRYGFSGNPWAKTPNLDALANTSTVFTNAHCSVPVCGPTRASLVTGLRPATHRIWDHKTPLSATVPDAPTLARHFRNNGYHTVAVGKVEHASFVDTTAWSERRRPRHPKHLRVDPLLTLPDGSTSPHSALTAGVAFGWGRTGGEGTEGDHHLATSAVDFLQQYQAAEPFFAAVGLNRPHLPLVAPDAYFDAFDGVVIPRPAAPPTRPAPGSTFWQHRQFRDEALRDAARVAAYASLHYADAMMGRVLDALAASGHAGDTIVVFITDHGFMLGEHGLWRKGALYGHSSRIAFTMRVPGMTGAGWRCERPVEQVDLFPTLTDLAAIPTPSGLESISMRPILEDPHAAWKKGAFTYRSDGSLCLADERYRLVRFADDPGATQLFDHASDPDEQINLADSKLLQPHRQRLERILDGGWRAALPD